MATISAARSLIRSSPLTRSAASRIASQSKSATRSPLLTKSPLSHRTVRCLPEMSFCVESMLPYHTATASALMTSMLSVSSYGWLSNASYDDV